MERKQVQAQQGSAELHQEQTLELVQQPQEVDHALVGQTDDLLAEIDGLLEENAEDFVKGFVQKGGQ